MATEKTKMREIRLMFPAEPPRLEGIVWLPEVTGPDGAGSSAGVVVCHPHPLYGGDMHNSMVQAVARALAAKSIAALRFNFRGVGRSQGVFDDGVGEQEDVREALTALASMDGVDPHRLGLAGYSFGARVALGAAAKDDRVRALAAISPAGGPDASGSRRSRDLPTLFSGPKLFIAGDSDEFAPADWLAEEVGKLPDPKELQIIPGVDHFWFGYEAEMAKRVAEFFEMMNAK